MGNYIFERESSRNSLIEDAKLPTSHDFGRDNHPEARRDIQGLCYDFSTNVSSWKGKVFLEGGQALRKDVGTIRAYWDAHMDLLQHDSEMTFYNPQWPIRTVSYADPPSYVCR